MAKNLPANAGDVDSIPGLGKSPREGTAGNLMGRQAWQAIVHEVAKAWT